MSTKVKVITAWAIHMGYYTELYQNWFGSVALFPTRAIAKKHCKEIKGLRYPKAHVVKVYITIETA